MSENDPHMAGRGDTCDVLGRQAQYNTAHYAAKYSQTIDLRACVLYRLTSGGER